MPEVLLHKIDEEFPPVNYDIGEHVLGRGDKLGCDSRKVSRKHGLLKISSDDISLTSTNNNPCLYQKSDETKIVLITFGNSIQINNGDKIALSLTHGWFRVEIKKEDTEIPSCSGQKRSTENDDEICSKKQKITDEKDGRETENCTSTLNTTRSQEDATLQGSSSRGESVEIQQDVTLKTSSAGDESVEMQQEDTKVQIKQETSSEEIKQKISSEEINQENSSEKIQQGNVSVNIKQEILSQEINIKTEISDTPSTSFNENFQVKLEPSDNIKQEPKEDDAENQGESQESLNNGASGSNGTSDRVWRDRCWYGDRCYRKNPAHRAEFSHPNDSDYESDSQDPRPVCCYGVGCYRKNKEHRKRYRHPGQTKLGTRPPGKGRNRKAKINAKKKKTPAYSDSEDDSYDLEHPFINDASSDEYEPSSSSETESDYEDDESQEDNKRLMREAKKFTKK